MSKWIAEFELEDGDTMPEHMDLNYMGAHMDFRCRPLEQESSDCISRQDAINSLGECPMNWTDSEAEITAERDWKDTVEMLKKLPSVTPQEPVIDKVKAEIEKQDKWLVQAGYNAYNVDVAFNSIKRVIAESEDRYD